LKKDNDAINLKKHLGVWLQNAKWVIKNLENMHFKKT